jgi:transcriptional repressor of cell division inhibition gene dicB
MKTSEVLAYYGQNKSAVARALEIDPSSVHDWGDYPPGGRQLQLELLTGGVLKAEPDCMNRKKNEKARA